MADKANGEKKLTTKQKVFINEYLVSFNATQAAIKAGYSEKCARAQGSRLLADAYISEVVRQRIEEKTMKADEILTRLADIARGDISEFMEVSPGGFVLDLTEKDDSGQPTINPNTKLIKKIKQKTITYIAKNESGEDREVTETELELYSAQEALQFLAKVNGLVVDRTDLTTDGKPITWADFVRGANVPNP